jgi:L-aminopeptidase/D-esterase-like protein
VAGIIDGLRIGHWTDREAATGLTVFLPPPGAVVAAETRGQSPGTLNETLLGPAGARTRADAIVLTGGSAYGMVAAARFVEVLAREGVGRPTPAGLIPRVGAAVVFDLGVGRPTWPGPAAADAAYAAAVPSGQEEVGSVGVGTGVTAGNVDAGAGATKGGFGRASRRTEQGATVAAWAVVNSVGNVVDEDGTVLAGLRRDGEFVDVIDALARDPAPLVDPGTATTLVVIATDARLDKLDVWRLARAGHGGIARAVWPSATGLDGDTCFAVSTGQVEGISPLAIEAVATAVTAAAIRGAVRAATGLHGVPALTEL